MDRWPAEAIRRQAETVGDMKAGEWTVQSRCPTCKLTLRVSLEALVKLHGPKFSLWNIRLPCRRVGCAGHVVFEGRPPNGRMMRLEAAQVAGPPIRPRQGANWL